MFRGPGDYFQRLKEVVAGFINMFITIYYGDQKSLLFNPSCSVINLLNSIKERCGYGDTDRVLDLTDETGNGGYTAFDKLQQVKHLLRIHGCLQILRCRQTKRWDQNFIHILFRKYLVYNVTALAN